MLELEKKPEEDLVASNRLARDDEGKRKFDGVVELESLERF